MACLAISRFGVAPGSRGPSVPVRSLRPEGLSNVGSQNRISFSQRRRSYQRSKSSVIMLALGQRSSSVALGPCPPKCLPKVHTQMVSVQALTAQNAPSRAAPAFRLGCSIERGQAERGCSVRRRVRLRRFEELNASQCIPWFLRNQGPSFGRCLV